MALQCGIIGLPNVGKSTLFNALSKGNVACGNFPFCTIEPNLARVSLPDDRLDKLAALVLPQRVVPAKVVFVDIAGLVRGASQGEGLGNKFLAHVREMDALVEVVRCFEDRKVLHVAGTVDPLFDLDVIAHELLQADLKTLDQLEKRIAKRRGVGKKECFTEQLLVKRFLNALKEGKRAAELELLPQQIPLLKEWHLLTSKPMLYVANIDQGAAQQGHLKKLQAAVGPTKVIPISIALEAEIAALPKEEQQIFSTTYGLTQSPLKVLIQAAYRLLGLKTYFTVGVEEVRAWTIKEGTLAPQAAGMIHSDFEKRFVKAEVIAYNDYLTYGTVDKCRNAGKSMIQGKQYVVQDGDIIHFRC